jgi:hypothetical protein
LLILVIFPFWKFFMFLISSFNYNLSCVVVCDLIIIFLFIISFPNSFVKVLFFFLNFTSNQSLYFVIFSIQSSFFLLFFFHFVKVFYFQFTDLILVFLWPLIFFFYFDSQPHFSNYNFFMLYNFYEVNVIHL